MPNLGAFAYRPASGGPDRIIAFGQAGQGNSIPIPGDYDGSGHDELAVYLPNLGAFAYRPASGGSDVITAFGPAGQGNSIPLTSSVVVMTSLFDLWGMPTVPEPDGLHPLIRSRQGLQSGREIVLLVSRGFWIAVSGRTESILLVSRPFFFPILTGQPILPQGLSSFHRLRFVDARLLHGAGVRGHFLSYLAIGFDSQGVVLAQCKVWNRILAHLAIGFVSRVLENCTVQDHAAAVLPILPSASFRPSRKVAWTRSESPIGEHGRSYAVGPGIGWVSVACDAQPTIGQAGCADSVG